LAAVSTPRRRRLFHVAAFALPWTLLLLLEIGLRVGGYGSAYPLFLPHAAQPEYLAASPAVAWRYFGNGPFTPTPELDLFRARKQPRTYRIFMQGESSAQGFPYGHGGAPSRMLEQRLQAAFPDREIEVVNTGLTAINSYALLDQAGEIIAQQPDAVLIYTGHNEYYGAFGVGSTRSIGHWRPLVKAYLMLRHVRTAQLMNALVTSAMRGGAHTPASDAPRTVMQLMAGDQEIPFGSPRYDEGLEQFRANLGELLARYRTRGIPVLIGTLASNERDQPPFISGLATGTDSTAWWQRYRAGIDAQERGDTAAAMRSLEAAVNMDSTAADAYYALGRLHDARGDTVRARAAYHAAKDRDQLRFRAPEAINAIIRDEAARNGAIVVETQDALARHATGGIIGRTLMLEHLHPNLDGYFIIADAFHDALRQRGLIGAWASPVTLAQARAEIPVTAVDSMIGLLRTDRLTAAWPFRPRGAARTPIVDTLRPANPVQQLAQAVVIGNLPWPEATERLRDATERAGDYEQSIRAARALALEYSYSAEPYMDAARVALVQHRYDDGLRYVRAANHRRETANGVQLAGLLMLRQGDITAALRCLKRAVELAPGDERIALSFRAAGAIPDLERRRATAPRDTTVLYDLGGAYALTQQYERSREALAALTRIAPNHAGARRLMGKLP
jgi:tetratricopeptide (TPR) repeat protein